MAVGLNNGLVIEYEKVFGKPPEHYSFYLKDISRDKLLAIGSHFLGFEHGLSKNDTYISLLSKILRPANLSFREELIKKIQKSVQSPDVIPMLITPESSLTFFEYAYEHGVAEDHKNAEEIEQSVVLGYLAINDFTRKKESLVTPSIKHLTDEHQLAALLFTQTYAYSNLANDHESELIYGQFVKAILFFEFLERTSETKSLLKEFLQRQQEPSWKSYLKKFLSLVSSILKHDKEGHLTIVVPQSPSYTEDCRFLDSLISERTEYAVKPDFISIRDKPMYKVQEGSYRIIFSLFVVEKIYKSLYFRLAQINNAMTTGRIGNLQSLIGEKFSERTLMYEILNRIYKGRSVAFTGEELKANGLSGEPDYYVRIGKRIFLFESKDFMIRGDIKTSFDYSQLEPELIKRLYKDQSNKGVLQLISNIEQILSRKFKADSGIPRSPIEIFPIIVLHDYQYNVLGLNKIVNEWFSAELKKLNPALFRFARVHPVTLINIDSLIYRQDILRSKKLKLNEVIIAYHRYTTFDRKRRIKTQGELRAYTIKTMVPFSVYLNQYIDHYKIHVQSSMLQEIGKRLFDN